MKRSSVLYITCLFPALFTLWMAGCAGNQPVPVIEQTEPIGLQLLRAEPTLRTERFSTLLDFESKDDAVFCTTVGGAGAVATDRLHTGKSAFKMDPATTRFTVKLRSLLAGRTFPDQWTLAGAYFYSDSPTKISVAFDPPVKDNQPRQVDLAPGSWTPVFAEVPGSIAPGAVPSLVFNLPSPHGPVWCDDLLLIDNNKVFTAPDDNSPSSTTPALDDVAAGTMPPWTVSRRGFNFIAHVPNRFDFKLITSQAVPGGWIIDQANPMRALFHSSTCPALAVYADGRAFLNGQYRPMGRAARNPILQAAHQAPAKIEVSEGMGRVDRNTPGDANNDGYNESTGSYRIIATGPRIELRFIPTSTPVLSPILEISGLPFGKPIVALEGRFVEQSTRTSTGTLLIELPAMIDRPVTVDVRIEQ